MSVRVDGQRRGRRAIGSKWRTAQGYQRTARWIDAEAGDGIRLPVGNVGKAPDLSTGDRDVGDAALVDGAGAVVHGAGLRRIGGLRCNGDGIGVVVREPRTEDEAAAGVEGQTVAAVELEHEPGTAHARHGAADGVLGAADDGTAG